MRPFGLSLNRAFPKYDGTERASGTLGETVTSGALWKTIPGSPRFVVQKDRAPTQNGLCLLVRPSLQRDTMTDRDLLALMIKRSGLSARAFARDVLWRDERTVRRWLAGDSPVPAVVADRLREQLE